MTVGERSDSSKPTSCQTQAMPYLYYCTILHSSLVATSNEFYGDASMCSAHFLPFYEKAVGSRCLAWVLWHISAFSNLSAQCFTPFHFTSSWYSKSSTLHSGFLCRGKFMPELFCPIQICARFFTSSWKLIRRLLFCIRMGSCTAN